MARVAAIQGQLAAYAPAPLPTPAPVEQPQESFQTVLDTQFGSGPAAPAIPGAAAAGTTAAVSGLGEPSPYDAMIVEAAQANNVPPALVKAVVRAESGFDPNAVSRAGAQGLMQLMPTTAAGLGVTDPFDPKQNLMGGAKFLRGLLDRFNGDVSKALAGYNAGPGAVEKYGGIPPYAETQAYVPKVLGFVDEYGGLAATGAPAAQPLAAASVNTAGIPAGYALVPLSALGIQAPGATAALVPTTATTTPTVPLTSGRGAQALGVARQYLGTPYRWGGESPATGFDCSGLMQYAFKQLGVSIPRVSQDQFRSGQQVPRESLQPGDLVFFSKAGDVHHVGMYVGDGKFLHAPHTGDVVKISSLSEPHYAAEYCGARRYG
jgi:cell wall-associated NlpC family hydrolase